MAADAEEICNIAMARLGANTVSDITTSPSTKEEVACAAVYAELRDEVLGAHNWAFAKEYLTLNPADGFEYAEFDEVTITGITQADPGVVTAAGHGFLDGWYVRIWDVTGMTEINGKIVRVDSKATDTFECLGLNTTKYTAYGSGGKCIRYEPLPDYDDGYVYDVPGDLVKPIALTDEDAQFELVGSGDSERILTDIEDAVLIYTAQKTTVTEYPNHFVRALAARIAAELAINLSQEGATFKDMWTAYLEIDLPWAKEEDARHATLGKIIREDMPMLDEGGFNL